MNHLFKVGAVPTRAEVALRARAYVGTPFAHMGRTLGHGIDCVGVPICVGRDLEITGTPAFDYTGYHLIPGRDELLKVLDGCIAAGWLMQKSMSDRKLGDIVTMCLPSWPTHAAIVTVLPDGREGIVHAYDAGERKCIEHGLDGSWLRQIRGCYEFHWTEDRNTWQKSL